MKDKRIDSFTRFKAFMYMNYYVLYIEELYLYSFQAKYPTEPRLENVDRFRPAGARRVELSMGGVHARYLHLCAVRRQV